MIGPDELRYRFECECNGEIPIGKKKPGEPGKELTMEHKARQYSDQMQCHACGKQWDVNDPHPPKCITERQATGKKWIGKLRRRSRRH